MRYLIAAAVLAASPAFAETAIARNGDQVMRLYSEPCTNEAVINAALPKIPEDMRKPLRKGAATIAGKDWAACWMMHNDHVDVFYEDGDVGYIPVTDFKPDGA